MKTRKRTKRVAIRRFVPKRKTSIFKEWVWRKGHGLAVYGMDGIGHKSCMNLKDMLSYTDLFREVPAKGK